MMNPEAGHTPPEEQNVTFEKLNNYIQEISEGQASYEGIKKSASALVDIFENENPQELDRLREYASIAESLDKTRDRFLKRQYEGVELGQDTIEEDFPDRGEIFKNINKVKYEALNKLPYEELTQEEKKIYLKSLSDIYEVPYNRFYENYHYFGWGFLGGETKDQQKAREMLLEVYKDGEKTLSKEEIDYIYEQEKDVYKIHLSIPNKLKIDVLKSIADSQRNGSLNSVLNYKMLELGLDERYRYMPDFVFYAGSRGDKTSQENMIDIANQVREVLSQFDIPQPETVPRFSTPVIIDGEQVPGMYYVNGNGDLKAQLLMKDSAEMLGKYYDSDKNYAVRKGEEVNFDRNQ